MLSRIMDFKGLTSLVVTLLLLRYAVVSEASNTSYQTLRLYTTNAVIVVEKAKNSLITKYSINESMITESRTKWYFGVSDCWNYSMIEDERLSDNYIRLKIFKNQSRSISSNVLIEIDNLQHAIKRMRKKLGYPQINTKGHPYQSLPTAIPDEQHILEVVFLSTVNKNLNLMLYDFQQRIPTKA